MGELKTYVALYDEIDPATEAIAYLHEHGVKDNQIEIITGYPVNHRVLGRPKPKSYIPWFALLGVLIGWGVAIFFAGGMTNLYPLKVGRQGLVNGAPTVVMLFEMMILFMLVFTFIGFFVSSNLPSYKPMIYLPAISKGALAIVFDISDDEEAAAMEALDKLGASSVTLAERRNL